MIKTMISKTVRGVDFQGRAFSDASGCPCTASMDGFTFAVDFLGEVCVNQLGEIKAPRRARLVAVSRVRAAYQEIVDSLGVEWREANAAMYVLPSRA